MPNHVTNRVEITSDEPWKIDKLIESMRTSDEKIFDFNSVIKMPEDSDTFQATGGVSMSGEGQSSRGNWYDWSRENWGTKWNAYRATMERNSKNQVTYTFQTAWDCPFPVIQKLAEKFEVYVRCAYYDEDFGNNCGIYDVDEFGLTGEKKDYSENGLEFIAEKFGEDVLTDHFYFRDDKGCWAYRDE